MFVLPFLLMTGLVLLLASKRLTLGFSLATSSILLYMAFMLLELTLIGKVDRTDWLAVGIWMTICALATGAAWLLSRRSTQP